jgi:hypothetical protein
MDNQIGKRAMSFNKDKETLEVTFPSGHSILYPNVSVRMLDRILSGKPDRIDRKIDRMLAGIQIRRKGK